MDVASVVTIAVAIVAALSAYASQRAAAKASVTNTETTNRVDMEKEAYDRARAFDTETIRRQDEELQDLRTKHERCNSQIQALREENDSLKRQVGGLVDKLSRLELELHSSGTHKGDTV